MNRTLLAILVGALMIVPALTPAASAQPEKAGEEIEAGVNSGYDGGPVEVTMYHHLFNLLDTVPMNTQPMDPAAPDLAQGRTAPTAETPVTPVPGSNKNHLFMYSSPGPVHYNESLQDPRLHPERGLGYDILLDTSAEPTVYWYMSADAAELLQEPPVHAGAMPQLEVTATLRLGDDIGGDLTAGQVVTQGSTTVDLVTPPDGGATEIVIPMETPQMNSIPPEDSFNLQVEWSQIDEGGVTYTDRQWNLHTGVDFPNRMTWSVENPIRMNYVHPQPIGDRKIAIHTAFVTPFGNYDVDLDNLTMSVKDDAGNEVIKYTDSQLQTGDNVQGPITVQKSYQHDAHYEPVLVTWVWNYRESGADPGDYTVEVSASNLQNSATAEKTASFTVQEQGTAQAVSSEGDAVEPQGADEEENDSPLGFAPVAAAIAGALSIAAYRRRRE